MISKRLLSIVLPIAVIIAAVLGSKWIQASKPAPESRSEPVSVTVVDATRLKLSQFPVFLRSQGTVQPTVTNALVPEVGGTVVALSPSFVIGGRFKAGDVLVEIDRRDYDIALTQAEANLAQANAKLQEQAALAERAEDEWKLLGRPGTPSALTLRVPQLAAARADRDAAQAQLSRAELDVERTRLISPYDGMVGEKTVNVGQFVARGTPIGSIYSLASADIKLPLSSQQIAFVDLQASTNVEIRADIGSDSHRWQGTLARVEGLDSASQQLNVVVQVDRPYSTSASETSVSSVDKPVIDKPIGSNNTSNTRQYPLRFGQFVQARITGQVLQDVFVIPRSALREAREVLLVNEDGEIERRSVEVAWSDETHAAIRSGLQVDEVLVTTPLSTVADGTPVNAIVDGVTLN